ncbi:hypothetical protein [Streptomyces kaempferi]|uniref:Uncharacterized protein n=1 Tax=Streptomyces kaempferi TaxID=333725 RepID=A0ABW3XUN2_9ACTN
MDRSTMSLARVAAKFAGYRELFRAKSRDNDPVLAEESASERMTHWWRRAYPGPARESCPPVALVLADASAKTLNNRAAMICDLTAEFWRGHRRTEDYSTDSWLDYGDSIPILVASLDTLTRLGPMGEVLSTSPADLASPPCLRPSPCACCCPRAIGPGHIDIARRASYGRQSAKTE